MVGCLEGKAKGGNTEYWNMIARKYAECVEMSEYDYGVKIRNIFRREEIISSDSVVIDIRAGPGSVAIPLAEYTRKVVAVEPTSEMVRFLLRNASKKGVTNIEVINKKWEEINVAEIEGVFDVAICCNVLQLFRDVDNQLLRIALISDYYCAAVSTGYDSNDFCDNLGFRRCKYSDLDCLVNIIRSMGWIPNLEVVDVVMKRSAMSAIRMWELFLARHGEVSEKDRKIIREYILSKSKDGVYEERGKWRLSGGNYERVFK